MKSRVRILFVCSLLAFAMSLGAMALQTGNDSAPIVAPAPGRHLLLKGVRSFGEVTPMLYRGGQATRGGFEGLAKMGISIVVDAGKSKREERELKSLGIRYVSIHWLCPFPKDVIFARFLKLIRENPDKKIFVHCHLGDDRTGMMVASYRMAVQGWTAEQAMAEMHSFRFTRFHHVMCPGLARYEKSFPRRLRNDAALRSVH